MFEPPHPGEVLCEEYMKPLGILTRDMSTKIGISEKHLVDIIKGDRSIDENLAKQIARVVKNSPEVWMQLQRQYDKSTEWHGVQRQYD